jgi:tripartite-type tricarboxylate transporter receptor subunit TctC
MALRTLRWLTAFAVAVTIAAASGAAALAQSTPIRFIVGLAPGGAVDPYARIIADHMSNSTR